MGRRREGQLARPSKRQRALQRAKSPLVHHVGGLSSLRAKLVADRQRARIVNSLQQGFLVGDHDVSENVRRLRMVLNRVSAETGYVPRAVFESAIVAKFGRDRYRHIYDEIRRNGGGEQS